MLFNITCLLTPLNLELLFTVLRVDWPPCGGCCSSGCSRCCSVPPNTAIDESLRRLLTHLAALASSSIMCNLWLLGLNSLFTDASSISHSFFSTAKGNIDYIAVYLEWDIRFKVRLIYIYIYISNKEFVSCLSCPFVILTASLCNKKCRW